MTGNTIHPESGVEVSLHASCVASGEKAVLIVGKSGSGKSTLALNLLACGASLVADDQTLLKRLGNGLLAACPMPLRGLIEVRGIGLLNAECRENVPIKLVVDMDRIETERLPERRFKIIHGVTLPCLRKVDGPHFSAAIMHYLCFGIREPS